MILDHFDDRSERRQDYVFHMIFKPRNIYDYTLKLKDVVTVKRSCYGGIHKTSFLQNYEHS